MSADLQNPIFNDETAAREALEAVRWPHGPFCPHCGNADPKTMPLVEGKKRSHRPGLRYCNACKGQFTVTVKTVFERSKVPLTKWWLATYLLGSSKKGMSSHQLHRMLGVTYKTAWFMSHRIREAMKELNPDPIGGLGKTVEADETYFGPVRRRGSRFKHGEGWKPVDTDRDHKQRIVSLVERGGQVRSVHAKDLTQKTVRDIVVRHASRLSALMTDEANIYPSIGREFASHETVKHSVDEWVRGMVHSNTVESVFAIFKRGMTGVYQHCGEQHLHRYLAEFDFRYNHRVALGFNDKQRVTAIMEGIAGKRLTYRRTHEAKVA